MDGKDAHRFLFGTGRTKVSYRASDGTRQWDGSKKVPEERMAVKVQRFARTGITPDIAGAGPMR